MALDPTLAEAHAELGISALFFDWDWPSAERRCQRAGAQPAFADGPGLLSLCPRARAELPGRSTPRAAPNALTPSRSWRSPVAFGLLSRRRHRGGRGATASPALLDPDSPEALRPLARLAEAAATTTQPCVEPPLVSAVGLQAEACRRAPAPPSRARGGPATGGISQPPRVRQQRVADGNPRRAAVISIQLGDPEAALDHLERAADAAAPEAGLPRRRSAVPRAARPPAVPGDPASGSAWCRRARVRSPRTRHEA